MAILIELNGTDVLLECEDCGEWEEQDMDEQRSHFTLFYFNPEIDTFTCRNCNEESSCTEFYDNLSTV